MTDWIPWFRYQLKASADGFSWAAEQLTPEYYDQLPPAADYLGTWSPVRHIWHVTEYERCIVLPSMRQWLGGELPADDVWPDDDPSWEAVDDRTMPMLLKEFHSVRNEQIDLLEQLSAIDWSMPRQTVWGHKALAMVVTKTFQHTYEHGDTLLRMGLWWADIAQRIADNKE